MVFYYIFSELSVKCDRIPCPQGPTKALKLLNSLVLIGLINEFIYFIGTFLNIMVVHGLGLVSEEAFYILCGLSQAIDSK